MKKYSVLATIAALALVMVLAPTQPAYAYIDPGSGTFVLQILGMFIVSGLFFFRQIIFQAVDRFKSLRAKLTGRSTNESNTSDRPDQK